MADTHTQTFDAIIIGGGPCGCTAATVLAQHGRRVALLERAPFPRYHVGESLLPGCYNTLDRLGVVDALNAGADRFTIRKYSVQFASTDGRVSAPFYFDQHVDGPGSQTWQVWRADFDQLLLDNAEKHGVEVLRDTSAKQLIVEDGRAVGVEAKPAAADNGDLLDLRAPITIDCSGRDGFAINRLGWRKRDPHLSKVALWTYYRGGVRDAGKDEGATTVAYLPSKCWFWHIPLPDDVISVGITGEHDYLFREGKDLRAIFARETQANRWMAERLDPAERFGEVWVTSDYSYRSRHSAMDGLVLAGDAFAFLDPVFSSGCFLALTSGEQAADAAEAALKAGDTSAGRFADYTERVVAAIEAMRKLVYAFYDDGFNFGKLLKKHPHLRGPLTDVLIGHVFGTDFTELFDAIAELADLPAPLPYGRPLIHGNATADSADDADQSSKPRVSPGPSSLSAQSA